MSNIQCPKSEVKTPWSPMPLPVQQADDIKHLKIGVVLLGFGAPDSAEGVYPFLENVLFSLKESNRSAFEARAKAALLRYEKIGGCSPLLEITRKQAELLKERLDLMGLEAEVYIAMRFWHPFIQETLEKARADEVQKFIVLSLSPQYTRTTVGACIKEFKEQFKALEMTQPAIFIENWATNPAYLDAVALKVSEGLDKFPQDQREKAELLFTAHSLPKKEIDLGDPYLAHMKATLHGILSRIGPRPWQLAFQSGRKNSPDWLGPEAGTVLQELAHEGKTSVLVVPLSFISDNIETLYDIDIELSRKAELLGITLLRSSCLNDAPQLIEAFCRLILENV